MNAAYLVSYWRSPSSTDIASDQIKIEVYLTRRHSLRHLCRCRRVDTTSCCQDVDRKITKSQIVADHVSVSNANFGNSASAC
jgi:hypothetical protein